MRTLRTPATMLALLPILLLAATAAAQVNLVPHQPAGWAWPLVPRPTGDATGTSVAAPTMLTGDATATYLNSAWRNAGTAASGTFHNNTVLDGQSVIVDRSCPSLSGGASGSGINGGPFNFLAGRHTLELRVDAGNAVAETNETDNNLAHQWVWTPVTIAPGTTAIRPEAPYAYGGHAAIPAGETHVENCDGVRFSTTPGFWTILYKWNPGASSEGSMCYYEPVADATGGFINSLGTSMRGGGGTDGFVANGRLLGAHTYDVGLIKTHGTGGARVSHTISTTLVWGDSISDGFAANEMAKIYEVSVPSGDIAAARATLQMATSDPSVMIMWLDRGFTIGSLESVSPNAATDAAGRASLVAPVTGAGYHAVMLVRDEVWGTGARSFGLKVGAAPPDYAPYAPAGWHSPLVPGMGAPGTPTSVPLPDTLPAYNIGFYVNWCMRNGGAGSGPGTSQTQLVMDGVPGGYWVTPALAPGSDYRQNYRYNDMTPLSGRHTLAIHADRMAALGEENVANNNYGEQYCWAPVTLAPLGDMGQDSAPPALTGGWEDVANGSGEIFYYNNHARRLPVAGSGVWWQGFLIAPSGGTDRDLSLCETLTGVKDGLGPALASSHWGASQTDYVLVNLNQTPRRTFDVTMTNYGGASGYRPQYSESTTLGTAGRVTLAPYVSPYTEGLKLFEWYFAAGWWNILLKNQSMYGKYGLTFHQATEVYTGKHVADSDYPPGGGDCWLHVYVPTPGWCCVAVWAQDEASLGTMRFQLSLAPSVTEAPGLPAVPERTALVGAAPNPFNPQTTVTFELATTGRARLAVYDLKGARVRQLVDADLAAGRQQVMWDGHDDAGRPAPSGTYVVRLQAGGVEQSQKLSLVK